MNKKYLIIGTLMIVGIVVLIYVINLAIPHPQEQAQIQEQSREPSESEKVAKEQNNELDKLRQQYQTQALPPIKNNPKNEVKNIDILRAQAIKQKPLQAPKKTPEQQLQELDILRAQARQQ